MTAVVFTAVGMKCLGSSSQSIWNKNTMSQHIFFMCLRSLNESCWVNHCDLGVVCTLLSSHLVDSAIMTYQMDSSGVERVGKNQIKDALH